MAAIQERHHESYLPQLDAAVCCRLCDPPQRVEVPARVFYRLKDADTIACPNGHRGTLLEYKQAASERSTAHGPFIRYDHHSVDWQTGNPWQR